MYSRNSRAPWLVLPFERHRIRRKPSECSPIWTDVSTKSFAGSCCECLRQLARLRARGSTHSFATERHWSPLVDVEKPQPSFESSLRMPPKTLA